jgi:hypothetical protein
MHELLRGKGCRMVMRSEGSTARRRPGKRARAAVVREVKDLLLKRVAAVVPDTFLAALGLDLPKVVEVLPGEALVRAVRERAGKGRALERTGAGGGGPAAADGTAAPIA